MGFILECFFLCWPRPGLFGSVIWLYRSNWNNFFLLLLLKTNVSDFGYLILTPFDLEAHVDGLQRWSFVGEYGSQGLDDVLEGGSNLQFFRFHGADSHQLKYFAKTVPIRSERHSSCLLYLRGYKFMCGLKWNLFVFVDVTQMFQTYQLGRGGLVIDEDTVGM